MSTSVALFGKFFKQKNHKITIEKLWYSHLSPVHICPIIRYGVLQILAPIPVNFSRILLSKVLHILNHSPSYYVSFSFCRDNLINFLSYLITRDNSLWWMQYLWNINYSGNVLPDKNPILLEDRIKKYIPKLSCNSDLCLIWF